MPECRSAVPQVCIFGHLYFSIIGIFHHPDFPATLMRVESYTQSRIRTQPKKDKLIDSIDEDLLQIITGYGYFTSNCHFMILYLVFKDIFTRFSS